MNIIETGIDGLVIIEPKIFSDDRGYFFESYNTSKLAEYGIKDSFVQDNESRSKYGTLRGLHYQKPPYTQSKLVRVIDGMVLDVAVDFRKGSSTYGKSYSVELSGENKRQFYVPRGFLHGFVVLSEYATFAYKCDNIYAPTHDGGVIFSDTDLGIDWKINHDDILLSSKDNELPKFSDIIPYE